MRTIASARQRNDDHVGAPSFRITALSPCLHFITFENAAAAGMLDSYSIQTDSFPGALLRSAQLDEIFERSLVRKRCRSVR
jgi:hypothetical protein